MAPTLKTWWNRWKPAWGAGRLMGGDEPAGRAVDPYDALYARLGVPRTLHYPNTTLARVLDQTADRFGDSPAVIYGATRWSYRQLLDTTNRLAGGLAHMGVVKGDRVLFTLPNCPEFIAIFFAVQKLGAVVVNAGPLMGADDLARLLELTGPRVAVTVDLQPPVVRPDGQIVPRLCVSLRGYQTTLRRVGYRYKLWQEGRRNNGHAAKDITLESLLEQAPPRPPTIASEPADLAVLQPTGGTTGTLKVARLSHRNLLCNATQVGVWGGLLDGQETILGLLPMFHAYGLTLSLITPVVYGAAMVPMTRFRIELLLGLIRDHRPTVLPMVPAILHAVCEELDRQPQPEVCDAMAGRIILSGAAPLPGGTAERFERITGASIMQGYGLTEASPVTHCNPKTEPRHDSIGLPMPDTRTRIAALHDERLDAPPGEAGELLISGPQVFGGYLGDSEQTDRVLTTDAGGRVWLRTGDVARVDSEGYFHVIDRRKEMINRGGEKVWPGRIERVLKGHPRVVDAAVIGRDDGPRGERVVAVVSLRQVVDDTTTLKAELSTLCREHLGRHEVPSEYEFTDKVPRSELGKLLKYQLREPLPPSRAA